jgi:hypothetical protein
MARNYDRSLSMAHAIFVAECDVVSARRELSVALTNRRSWNPRVLGTQRARAAVGVVRMCQAAVLHLQRARSIVSAAEAWERTVRDPNASAGDVANAEQAIAAAVRS